MTHESLPTLPLSATPPRADAAPRSVLIVDDERIVHTQVPLALGEDAFRYLHASNAEEGWRLLHEERPDLLLCDYDMPGITGVELIRRVRAEVLLAHLPIVLLTAHGGSRFVVRGLEAGADDYLQKPFDPDELAVRVTNQLRRGERDRSADAVSGLPSGEAIPAELERRIAGAESLAVVYADLDHFKPFVDRFGFLRATGVVRRMSELLVEAFRERAGGDAFVGHVAGDDFVALCRAEHAEDAATEFLRRFEAARNEFHEPDDLLRGGYRGFDRAGLPRDFPLLAVSMCLVDGRRHALGCAQDVVRLAFGVRAVAKGREGNSLVQA